MENHRKQVLTDIKRWNEGFDVPKTRVSESTHPNSHEERFNRYRSKVIALSKLADIVGMERFNSEFLSKDGTLISRAYKRWKQTNAS